MSYDNHPASLSKPDDAAFIKQFNDACDSLDLILASKQLTTYGTHILIARRFLEMERKHILDIFGVQA